MQYADSVLELFLVAIIHSGVKGALVTVNKRLVDEPWHVTENTLGMGHIGLIMRKNGACGKLLDEQDYSAVTSSNTDPVASASATSSLSE